MRRCALRCKTSSAHVLTFAESAIVHPIMAASQSPASLSPEAAPGASKAALTTVHLYYSDTEVFSNAGRVMAVYETEGRNGKQLVVVTDQTVMHPQGGARLCRHVACS